MSYAKSSVNISRLIVRVSWGAVRTPLRRSGRSAMVALLRLLQTAVAAAGRAD